VRDAPIVAGDGDGLRLALPARRCIIRTRGCGPAKRKHQDYGEHTLLQPRGCGDTQLLHGVTLSAIVRK
jgi:hypothetical protein